MRCGAVLASWLILITGGLVACSAQGENEGTGASGQGAGSGSGNGAGSGAGGDTVSVGVGVGTGSSGAGGAGSCASATEVAQPVEVNMFISFDKSGSMDGDDKWDDATAALSSFFQDPGTEGLRVAMRFFGDDLPIGDGCSQYICNIGACAVPHVDVDDLRAEPNDPHEQALLQAIAARQPGGGGGTPIHPALSGATQWAKAYKDGHPSDEVVVILVTDGSPQGCIESVPIIASVASDALSSHDVKTYTIGLAGSSESTMNTIAQAGGTGQSFFINGGDVTADLLAALEQIKGEASLPCQYQMPQGENVNPGEVNVDFTPSGSAPEAIGQVPNAGACGGVADGWYYDDPGNPSSIIFCPQTCDAVQGDAGARVDIVVGCETVVAPPK